MARKVRSRVHPCRFHPDYRCAMFKSCMRCNSGGDWKVSFGSGTAVPFREPRDFVLLRLDFFPRKGSPVSSSCPPDGGGTGWIHGLGLTQAGAPSTAILRVRAAAIHAS
eukprot:m.681883 g.681883  ORF g.681883 m.681883 type:complete len:109 (-) comp22815_c0_seq6:2905-3231(-)